MFLYALYLDPLETLFLSPVEFMSLEVEKSNTVVELFDAVRGLARVKIATKHNAAKEAGFLYWSLGHITKIP